MSDANDTADNVVNKRLIKHWLIWSMVWLTLYPLVGLLVSIKFHLPDFLGETSWLTFGRLRPVHVNGVIFGAFSAPFIGLLYYVIPRLCGRRMAKEHWGWWQLWVWNIFLTTGAISFMLGINLGYEADEFQWPWNIMRWVVIAALCGQALVTMLRRKEAGFYISLWYATAALTWTVMNLVLGNVILPYLELKGISNAAMHGLYIHYVVGLWITPGGLCLMYYFIPVATKNPLFSHGLSKIGFWTLAFFYPFVGTHHYLFSPIPYHNQTISIVTSMGLIIPVWAVVANHIGTYFGRWGAVLGGKDADAYAAKFLLLGAFWYLLGCFQGSVEALRGVQVPTHFTDFVIGHSHLTVFGTFVVAVMGCMYYVWPRVTGRQLWSPKLASWHLWLTIIGAGMMFTLLTAQGFVQGSMLHYGGDFVDSLREMVPWWWARTLMGLTMDIGIALMAVNLYMTAKHGAPFTQDTLQDFAETHPSGEEVRWYSRPTSVALIAGVGFFYLAVIIQGVYPSLMPEMESPELAEHTTGFTIQAVDYTEQEARGRLVYIREGCWYCHSQYVRPFRDELMRWGPVSQAGEYAYDQPHLFGTRRTGPDLWRVGGKYGDDWHIAHHWNPRAVVPDSIMPRFPWLFEKPEGDEPPRLNEDGKALIAYIQKLGTNIGAWRETFIPTRLNNGDGLRLSAAQRRELTDFGKQLYQRRCIGCHGKDGDGEGPAAKFLNPKPRDFTTGIFKFRSTTGDGNSLPSDQDLFVSISHGLAGTAMPGWYKLPRQDRLALIQYIKTFSERWEKEEINAPVQIPPEPPVTQASLDTGRRAFQTFCELCHGKGGEGDGPAAATLTTVWGDSIRPANFTLPVGESGGVKLGHNGRHIFKTIMTGVGGTPMPRFDDSLSGTEVWHVVHYVQSLRIDAWINTLRERGLSDDRLEESRRRLWAALSDAADSGEIGTQVVQKDRLERPESTATNIDEHRGAAHDS